MSVKEKLTQRKMVRSPGEIIPIVVFSVIARGDSHKKKKQKNTLFTHIPCLLGACSALASIIGSEAVSSYPFHCVKMYVCVCISLQWLFICCCCFFLCYRSNLQITFCCQTPQPTWP